MDAEAFVHIVMDAYHGDVVSVSGRLEVNGDLAGDGPGAGGVGAGGAGVGAEGTGADGAGADGAGAEGAGADGGGAEDTGEVGGGAGGDTLPVVTVTVRASQPLPVPPEASAWHVRFVVDGVTIDARDVDGTLVDLVWEEQGFTVRLCQPAGRAPADVHKALMGAGVAHVVVVPEGRRP